MAVPTMPPPAPHGVWGCPATPSHWAVPWMGWGAPPPFPGLPLPWVPGHCFCLCCCATGWFLVATSPCCGRRWVPYAGAFIPSADRQPAVWLSNPNCSQCAWTKNCLERWQGLGADDMLGIFPLPWTPPVSSPTSHKNGRQQLGFAGRVGCLPPVLSRVGAESCPKAGQGLVPGGVSSAAVWCCSKCHPRLCALVRRQQAPWEPQGAPHSPCASLSPRIHVAQQGGGAALGPSNVLKAAVPRQTEQCGELQFTAGVFTGCCITPKPGGIGEEDDMG